MSEATPQLPETDEVFDEAVTKSERVALALEACKGNLAATSRYLCINRSRLNDYINTKPELRTLLLDLRESILDKAESNVFADVEKGDGFSSRFVLSTLGKDRGWVPRQEATGKDGKDLAPPTIIFQQYPEEMQAEEKPATSEPE